MVKKIEVESLSEAKQVLNSPEYEKKEFIIDIFLDGRRDGDGAGNNE